MVWKAAGTIAIATAIGLIVHPALAQNGRPPPIKTTPTVSGANTPTAAQMQQTLPNQAEGVFGVTGQGSIRWSGGFCAPKASEASTVCTRTVTANQQITIEATPRPGQEFKGWSGACNGTVTRCTFTPSKKFALTATFAEIPSRTVTVYLMRTAIGGGFVEGGPNLQFDCQPIGPNGMQKTGPVGNYNTACVAKTGEASVSLKGRFVTSPLSTPVTGKQWNGDCLVGQAADTCFLQMTQDRTVYIGTQTSNTQVASGRKITIYTQGKVAIKAFARSVTPFATPSSDPGTPVAITCSYILATPGSGIMEACTATTNAVILDLFATYPDGTKVMAENWTSGCYSKDDNRCIVMLDKDKNVYVKPKY